MMGHIAKSKRHFHYLCSSQYKQGKEACGARMLPKVRPERQIIAELRSRVLTDEDMEALVSLTNDQLLSAQGEVKERLDVIDAEMRDARDLRHLLVESDLPDRKALLRTFVKRI